RDRGDWLCLVVTCKHQIGGSCPASDHDRRGGRDEDQLERKLFRWLAGLLVALLRIGGVFGDCLFRLCCHGPASLVGVPAFARKRASAASSVARCGNVMCVMVNG